MRTARRQGAGSTRGGGRGRRATDERAEANVLGVILVIAIAIALAVSIFFFAGRLTQSTETAKDKPDLAFAIDPNEPKATVIRSSDGLDWARDLRIGGDCAPTLNGGAFPTAEGTPVRSTDVVECEWGEQLTIASVEGKGNALLFRHRF